jgi:hypothetical protein
MGQLVGNHPPGDDVAVLALRRLQGGEIGAVAEVNA